MSEVIYEVNLAIKKEIFENYIDWLKPHIVEILRCKGFLRAEILADLEKDDKEPESRHVLVQYRVKDMASLQDYFDHHAAAMRQDGKNRFGENFSATRRVLHTTHAF